MNETDLAAQLAEQLDGAFGDGPAPPPVEGHLRSGRRALLRRRASIGAGALAVLVAVGTGFAVTSPLGASGTRGVDPATQPPPPTDDGTGTEDPCSLRSVEPPSAGDRLPPVDPSEGVAGCVVAGDRDDGPGAPELVALGDDGELVLGDGVRLLERIDDPFGPSPKPRSVSVAVARDGEVIWSLLSGGSEVVGPPDDDYADLAAWTDAMVAIVEVNGGPDGTGER